MANLAGGKIDQHIRLDVEIYLGFSGAAVNAEAK